MNNKTRLFRFELAYVCFGVAFIVGADALGNWDTKDYYHDLALAYVLGFVGFANVLLTWNYIQLTKFRKASN